MMRSLTRTLILWLILAIVIAGLNACGGSSGSDGASQVLTGRFIDGPVSGLRYVTDSRSGTTSADGEFSYLSGETVSFYVGDILIGRAAGAATLTPFDLAGMAVAASPLAIRQLANGWYK